MKRLALIAAAALGLVLSNGVANAGFGTLSYGGYQPWWNPCAIGHRKCKTCEERRLEHFWHDYYDSLRKYYKALEHVDWVAYYKNHGYQINGGCGYGPGGNCCGGAQRIQFAPVFVSPTMNWAVPNSPVCGPPAQPPIPPVSMYGGMPPMPGPGGFGPMPMPYAH